MNSEVIKLTEDDMKVIYEAAAGRTAANRGAGNPTKLMTTTNGSHNQNEVVGLMGEIAVTKYLCLERPTLVFDQAYFRENKHAIKDVGSYEVKSTTHKNGKLILQQKHMTDERLINQKYILCICDIQACEVRLAGWATPAIMSEFGEELEYYNVAWYLGQNFMQPMDKLLAE